MIAWIYLDKKTASVDALKDYASMEYIIKNHSDRMETVRANMTKTPAASITGMPKKKDPKSGEERLAASLDEIDILKERYRRALEYMEWFQPAWDALTDDDRYVLAEFFWNDDGLQYNALNNICVHFHIERSSAYKKKSRAIERLATLLYGK